MRPETSSRFDSAGWHGKDRHATKLSIVPEGKADDDIADLSCTARTDQPDIVRWYSLYRKAFPWAGITCPAEAVRVPAVAKWVKKHGYAIDVRSSDELTLAISADIPPARIIMHDDGATAGPIRRAVNVGVGRFVISSSQQIAVLASCAQRPQRVLIDVTTDQARDAVNVVLARNRLNLIGLHFRLVPEAAQIARYADVVGRMIAQMAQIRRDYGVILTRVSLAGGNGLSGRTPGAIDLPELAAAIEDAFDHDCARYRFPRPALVLAPLV